MKLNEINRLEKGLDTRSQWKWKRGQETGK